MLRLEQPHDQDWTRARREAALHALRARLAGRSVALVPLHDVQLRLPFRGSRYRGLQQVPLDRIVGSENRTADFDRCFLPRHAHLRDRWLRVNRAHRRADTLPPVDLYQIGDVSFVRDGHHRVSVARAHRRVDIDAVVIELVIDVPLTAPLQAADLLLKEEYNDFLEWTNLHRLRPGQHIEPPTSGSYLELVGEINRYRDQIALERGVQVPVDAAVTGWYDNVYLPRVTQLRHQHTGAPPSRRSLWLRLGAPVRAWVRLAQKRLLHHPR